MSSTKRITVERLNEVLVADFESGRIYFKPRGISWWDTRYANKEAFTINSHGYLVGTVDKVRLLKHRVLWAMKHNYWPEEIDHINRDPLDNRLDNLREVTRLDNQRNMTKMRSNTSGRTGVYYHKRDKLWVAYIGSDKRLGYFNDYNLAVEARELAEEKLGYTLHGNR